MNNVSMGNLMQEREFRLKSSDGHEIFVRQWLPETGAAHARAVIQINHGMAEHITRYRPIAERLTRAGIVVFAHDTRGHGYSVQRNDLLGHYADDNGWNKVVLDVKAVNEHIRNEYPRLPLTIFGHSMGSFVVRSYLQRHGDTVNAAMLSGTAFHTLSDVLQARAGIKLETYRLGPKGRSPLLDMLSFGTYNKVFEPTRTGADWLSRDPREVDKYVNDPLCGFHCTNKMWSDMVDGIEEIRSIRNVRRIPKAMPMLIFSGERDPLSFNAKAHGINKLLQMYENVGMKNVSVKLFPNGRHEILNETNRLEVVQFLIDWLEHQQLLVAVPAKKRAAKKAPAH